MRNLVSGAAPTQHAKVVPGQTTVYAHQHKPKNWDMKSRLQSWAVPTVPRTTGATLSSKTQVELLCLKRNLTFGLCLVRNLTFGLHPQRNLTFWFCPKFNLTFGLFPK